MKYLTREEIKKVAEYYWNEDIESILQILDMEELNGIKFENATNEEIDLFWEIFSTKINKEDIEWMKNDEKTLEMLPDIIIGKKDVELIQEVVENDKDLFDSYDKVRMIKATDDPQYIKNKLTDKNFCESLRNADIANLLVKTDDAFIEKFLRESEKDLVIETLTKLENSSLTEMFLDDETYNWWDFEIYELILATNDNKFVKKIVDSGKYKINRIPLIIKTGNNKFIMQMLEDKDYNWTIEEKKCLAISTEDIEYIKQFAKINDLQFKDILETIFRMEKSIVTKTFIKEIMNDKDINICSSDVCNLLNTLEDFEDIKECLLDKELLENPNYPKDISDIIIKFDESKRKELLENLSAIDKKDLISNFRRNMNQDYIQSNLSFFMRLEGVKEDNIIKNKEYLMKMFQVNRDILKDIDFSILDSKYIDSLGVDKINQISCYPNIQEKVLQLSDPQLQIFSECIEHCNNERWTPLAQAFLDNLSEYEELIINISQIEDVDYDTINIILQDKNVFEIKSVEDVKNYEQIKEKKCDEWIKSDNIEERKLAVLEKLFGQSVKYSESLIEKYGYDIDKLQENDLKDYIQSVKSILEIEDPSVLEDIYKQCRETANIDKISIEESLKSEYCKLYNKGLFFIDQSNEIEEGVYDAGTNFEMIITALGAFNANWIENYKDDWNRPTIASQHFCASYIRNDMLGTAPINNICYRFLRDGTRWLSTIWKYRYIFFREWICLRCGI